VNEPILLARIERGEDGRARVLSPGVGWWSHHPQAGALLGPGSRIGTLGRLGRRFALVLPDGASGRVTGPLPRDLAVPLEYAQPLFELAPVPAAGDARALAEHAAAIGQPAATGLPPGARAVVSPTDGIFYRGTAPGARPLVESGTRIRTGQPLGLVEVMKTFHPIVYGGPGFPEEAQVVEVRCGDAEEVRAGQVLVVVR
jgi:acetyl-CoA carboxylase biotin carboxyl carrier protein